MVGVIPSELFGVLYVPYFVGHKHITEESAAMNSNDQIESLETLDTFSYLPQVLQDILQSQGIETPTQIQKDTIIPALKGRDVLAQSQTGSGKTLAFAIPIGMRLAESEPTRSPRALILAPTRELALQVRTVFATTLSSLGLKCTAIIGGDAYHRQKRRLQDGADIVVGTPGRIVDLIGQSILKLDNIDFFVLDEVDQMLDIGFAKELALVHEALPKEKQTLLFSATMNKRMESLAKRFLSDPVEVKIAPELHSPKSIEHGYFAVKNGQELPALVNVLLYHSPSQALIFCETRQDCRIIAEALETRGFNAALLNSDLSQQARTATLRRFRDASLQYLVATNVAARGLDINGLPLVINYDVPYDAESYTHRTGRTGRAGEKGQAWTIVSPRNSRRFQMEMQQLDLKMNALELPNRPDILEKIAEREIVELEKRGKNEASRRVRRITDRVLNSLEPDEIQVLLRGFLQRQLEGTNAYNSYDIAAEEADFFPRHSRSRRSGYPNARRNGRPSRRNQQNRKYNQNQTSRYNQPRKKAKATRKPS